MYNTAEVASELGALGKHGRVELHGLRHVSLDLHLAVHESILRLELASEELDEVSIEHDESSIGFTFLAKHDGAIAVLHVNSDDLGLVTLLHAHLEMVDGANFGDNSGTLRGEQGLDFLEDLNGLHI